MTNPPVFQARLVRASRVSGAVLVVLGAIVLWAWTQGIDGPTRLVPTWPNMKANAALCLLLLGLALATRPDAGGRWTSRLRDVALGLTLAIGLLTLVEYGAGLDLGLDQLLVPAGPADAALAAPGRMSLLTAANFVLLSLALMIQARTRPGGRSSFEYSCFIVLLVSTLALFGFVFGAYGLAGAFLQSNSMALHTVLAQVAAAVAVLCRRPDLGRIELLAGDGEVASLARRSLVRGTVVAIAIVLAAQYGFSHHWYDAGYRGALLSTSLLFVGAIAVWSDLARLRRAEAATSGALAELRVAKDTLEATVRIRTAELAAATERSQASEARLRLLVDGSRDHAIFALSSAGTIVTWNGGAERIMGYRTEEIVDRHFSIFFSAAEIEDGRPQRILDAAARDGSVEDEGWSIPKNGRPLWASTVITALRGPAGELLGFSDVTRDLTDRREAEEVFNRTAHELDSLVSSSPLAIVSVTGDGTVLRWNPAAEATFGWTAEEIVGLALPSVPADRREEAAAWWQRALAGEVLTGLETRRQRKSGTDVDVSLSIAPLRAPSGEVTSLVFLYLDIDDRKRAEAQLARYLRTVEESRALAELQAADMARLAGDLEIARNDALESARLKASFLATMSHEIRTPLNGVIGMTGLLLDTGLTPVQRRYAETARVSGEGLLALINDILDFSKIEAGKLSLECAPVDVRSSVEDVLDLLAERALAGGTELLGWVDAAVPAVVEADPGRLRQVLTNLVGNAVKFTHRGEVCVRLRMAEGGRSLGFEVSDTGIGMTEGETGRLFEAFSQADASTTRKYGGTGLGLAISKQIVEAMGGAIGVRSRVGEGSTFWFTIPLAGDQSRAAEGRQAGPELTGLRILCVDDNAVAVEMHAEVLRGWGAVVSTAAGSMAAYALLRDAAAGGGPFDLIVLDQRMPAPDGAALARVLAAETAFPAPAIVLLKELGAGSHEAAVAATVTKPVRRAALADAIALARGVPEDGATSPAAAAGPPGPCLRVLVAEDNRVNQLVAAQNLVNLGHRVDLVANGIEARDAVSSIPYDLVLMDCEMPELDGYDATRAIRARENGGPRVPIIAMTANALDGDRQRCLAAGMDDYLSKPFTRLQLDGVLRRWSANGPARTEADAPGAGPSETEPAGGETPILDPDVIAALRELSAMTPGFLREVVGSFLAELPARLESMTVAVVRCDSRATAAVAHTLKGSAGNLGAPRLAAACDALERLAMLGDWAATGPALADVLAEAGTAATALTAEADRRGASARRP